MRLHDLLAVQSSLNNGGTSNDDLEGIVVAGSWNPTTATIQVTIGDTYAIANDNSGDQFAIVTATVGTTYNDQYGPVGGERVHLQRVGAGWVAHFEHADDDSPGAPAGERWIVHRNASGAIIGFLKLTNDGIAAGDGLGGLSILAGAFLQFLTTGGYGVQADDANSETLLGQLSAIVTGNPNKVARYSDLQTLVTALNNHYHGGTTAATGTAIGNVTTPSTFFTVPPCSNSVKAS
jgi:hypothetical protein